MNFRQGPSKGTAAYTPVSEGKNIYLIINEIGPDDGTMWTKVNVDGKEGYIKSEFIDLMGPEKSKAYDAAQSTPAPVYEATPAPTAEPTAAPTDT